MKRRQLTLFLDERDSVVIELIRKKFNKIQYDLIKSHITLCREDEIEDLERIQNKLGQLDMHAFELHIGELKRFSEEKGVLITLIDKEDIFLQLREWILKTGNTYPRVHMPHIILMHPRNSTCDDQIFREIQKFELPKKLKFSKISLIEQEMGSEWKTLKEYELIAIL